MSSSSPSPQDVDDFVYRRSTKRTPTRVDPDETAMRKQIEREIKDQANSQAIERARRFVYG